MAQSTHLLLLLPLICGWAFLVEGEVVLVYSIQRHGARNVLPKSATLSESDSNGGPTLLPEGQRQAWEAGTDYRARYIDPASCAAPGTCLAGGGGGTLYGVVNSQGNGFNNYNMLVRSSGLDRTIMTALSFLDGALPPNPSNATADKYLPDGQQVVPVYTRADSEDTLIRAYAKCSAYQARLKAWFDSEEFRAKEAESAALRNEVGALTQGALDVSLKNWWNVYDSFNVWRTYGVGTPMPEVSNQTFSEMQSLANWLECAKMASNLTDAMLAGPLLADLLAYMQNATRAVDAGLEIYYKVLHLSGHYNTQLGVLGALRMDTHAPDFPWMSRIPKLAALMAFELHANRTQQPPAYAVRLVYQDGPAAEYGFVPLPCTDAEGEAIAGPGTCSLESFYDYVSPVALTATQWCAACQDNSTSLCRLDAATKQVATLQAELAGQATTESPTSSSATSAASCSNDDWKIGVAVAVTFVGTALVVGGTAWWMMRSQRTMWRRPMAMQMAEVDKP